MKPLVIDLCGADGFCMEEATHAVVISVRRRGVRGAATRSLKTCARHLAVLEEHAESRRRGDPKLTIFLDVTLITVDDVQTIPVHTPKPHAFVEDEEDDLCHDCRGRPDDPIHAKRGRGPG